MWLVNDFCNIEIVGKPNAFLILNCTLSAAFISHMMDGCNKTNFILRSKSFQPTHSYERVASEEALFSNASTIYSMSKVLSIDHLFNVQGLVIYSDRIYCNSAQGSVRIFCLLFKHSPPPDSVNLLLRLIILNKS